MNGIVFRNRLALSDREQPIAKRRQPDLDKLGHRYFLAASQIGEGFGAKSANVDLDVLGGSPEIRHDQYALRNHPTLIARTHRTWNHRWSAGCGGVPSGKGRDVTPSS